MTNSVCELVGASVLVIANAIVLGVLIYAEGGESWMIAAAVIAVVIGGGVGTLLVIELKKRGLTMEAIADE